MVTDMDTRLTPLTMEDTDMEDTDMEVTDTAIPATMVTTERELLDSDLQTKQILWPK